MTSRCREPLASKQYDPSRSTSAAHSWLSKCRPQWARGTAANLQRPNGERRLIELPARTQTDTSPAHMELKPFVTSSSRPSTLSAQYRPNLPPESEKL